ncbi:CAF17-like 4Fe-4S cluster assembly/insertion protein YgfZ [Nisaea nitritireducens]|uniref:CAF17-like 4Fe-4S cluster assembly/insertion protein YgfZ n=1 Tax=Nisaea nitritireducens TaxID=568392 RepID=UPI001865A972|nr:folate-binding protein YgfZ [Nisaea nitritireducens]
MAEYIELKSRGVLSVSGPDARKFLQGLISNDVEKVSPERAIHAAFLTAQGKYLFDFMIAEVDGALLLDCEADRLADFQKRLKLYKLRSDVTVEDVSAQFSVLAITGDDVSKTLGIDAETGAAKAVEGGAVFTDPRHAGLGARAIIGADKLEGFIAAPGLTEGTQEAYDLARIKLGVPDGTRDMQLEKTILLEAGFDELNGVDWKKGCYMGQELTARTKYRGLVKRRLMPVRILDGEMPAPGTPVMRDDREVGEIRSGAGTMALAMLRVNVLEDLEHAVLSAGGSTVLPVKPDWATF